MRRADRFSGIPVTQECGTWYECDESMGVNVQSDKDLSGGSPLISEATPLRFEDFYEGRRNHLARALAITLRSDDLGNEAADEAMTRAYQRWRTVRGYSNPMGWLYRVGLNWARTRLRKEKREVPVPVPERAVEDKGVFEPELEAALAEITVDQRAVLVLRFYFDWDIDRVAHTLEIPVGTVKSRQKRGLEAVERRLEVRR